VRRGVLSLRATAPLSNGLCYWFRRLSFSLRSVTGSGLSFVFLSSRGLVFCLSCFYFLDLVCSVAFLFPSRFLFYQCYCSGYVTVPSGCGLDLLLFRRRLCHYSVGFPVYVIVSVSLLSVVF
jgi:hypothetical protein